MPVTPQPRRGWSWAGLRAVRVRALASLRCPTVRIAQRGYPRVVRSTHLYDDPATWPGQRREVSEAVVTVMAERRRLSCQSLQRRSSCNPAGSQQQNHAVHKQFSRQRHQESPRCLKETITRSDPFPCRANTSLSSQADHRCELQHHHSGYNSLFWRVHQYLFGLMHSGRVYHGYILSSDPGWDTVMLTNRQIVYLHADEVVARSVCQPTTTLEPAPYPPLVPWLYTKPSTTPACAHTHSSPAAIPAVMAGQSSLRTPSASRGAYPGSLSKTVWADFRAR